MVIPPKLWPTSAAGCVVFASAFSMVSRYRSRLTSAGDIGAPGRPGAPMSPAEVSLDLYRDTILKALAKTTHPAALVGHSFGGITISAVAEAAPERVKTLVYVAAYLPQDGDSL